MNICTENARGLEEDLGTLYCTTSASRVFCYHHRTEAGNMASHASFLGFLDDG